MNKYSGSNFDDFLEEEGILGEVTAKVHNRLLALQLSDIMKESDISKTKLPDYNAFWGARWIPGQKMIKILPIFIIFARNDRSRGL